MKIHFWCFVKWIEGVFFLTTKERDLERKKFHDLFDHWILDYYCYNNNNDNTISHLDLNKFINLIVFAINLIWPSIFPNLWVWFKFGLLLCINTFYTLVFKSYDTSWIYFYKKERELRKTFLVLYVGIDFVCWSFCMLAL